jgi:hypothetical protein
MFDTNLESIVTRDPVVGLSFSYLVWTESFPLLEPSGGDRRPGGFYTHPLWSALAHQLG